MKRNIFEPTIGMYTIEEFEGETIETKCARITNANEPISDAMPLIFTEKKDGVLPQFDIRTDRFEIANEAMEAVNRTKLAMSKQYQDPNKKEPDEQKKE